MCDECAVTWVKVAGRSLEPQLLLGLLKPQQAKLNHPPNLLLTLLRLFAHSCTSLCVIPAHISTIDLLVLIDRPLTFLRCHTNCLTEQRCISGGGWVGTFAPAEPVIKVWRYMWNHYTAQLPGDADPGIQGRNATLHLLSYGRPTPEGSSSSGVRWVQTINPSPLMRYGGGHV